MITMREGNQRPEAEGGRGGSDLMRMRIEGQALIPGCFNLAGAAQ
jgi:hypothetical protein